MFVIHGLLLLSSLLANTLATCPLSVSINRTDASWLLQFSKTSFMQPVQTTHSIHPYIHSLWTRCRSLQLSFRVNTIYTSLFTGISITPNSTEVIDILRGSSLVESVSLMGTSKSQSLFRRDPILGYSEATSAFKRPKYNPLNPAHKMTGILNIPLNQRPTGKNIKVGIIDTGLDFNHPCFNGRVLLKRSFEPVDKTIPNEFREVASDVKGHGTFVAGIIGGYCEGFSGVAPDTQYGIYKVAGCANSIPDDLILQAVEQAFQDGMDIISISLGSFRWIESHVLCENHHLLKTIFIVSNGNDGPTMMSTNHFASRIDTLAVSSIDVESYEYLSFEFTLLNQNLLYPYHIIHCSNTENDDTFFHFNWVMVELDASCQMPLDSSIKDKIVVFEINHCSLEDTLRTLESFGAKGVTLLSNEDFQEKCIFSSIPIVQINNEYAFSIKFLLAFNNKVLPKNAKREMIISTSGKPSSFNSWGPSINGFRIKPDIMAPGGYVSSTTLIRKGSFTHGSGSSFAAPYISGVAALYLQQYPKANYDYFHHALMNNAIPIRNSYGIPHSIAIQGAGLVNVPGTLFNKVTATPHKLELGILDLKKEVVINIINSGSSEKKYRLSHIQALSISFFEGKDAEVDPNFNMIVDIHHGKNEIQIAPNSKVEMKVEFELSTPYPNDCLVISGYISLQDLDPVESQRFSMNIPYLGMHLRDGVSCIRKSTPDRIQDAKGSGLSEMPYMLLRSNRSNEENIFKHESENVVTHLGQDHLLIIVFPIYFHVKMITLDVHDETNDSFIVKNLEVSQVIIHGKEAEIDIKKIFQNTPNGQYRIKAAIKSLEFGNAKADVEYWVSPLVTIVRDDVTPTNEEESLTFSDFSNADTEFYDSKSKDNASQFDEHFNDPDEFSLDELEGISLPSIPKRLESSNDGESEDELFLYENSNSDDVNEFPKTPIHNNDESQLGPSTPLRINDFDDQSLDGFQQTETAIPVQSTNHQYMEENSQSIENNDHLRSSDNDGKEITSKRRHSEGYFGGDPKYSKQ